jgi:hypothetical protein
MTDDTETDTTDEQSPDQLAGWLRDIDNDEITLRLDDGTEADVSVVRSLYLPHSVNTDIGGGSLRHAVRTSEDTAERLGLPSRRGLIAAEERDRGSWTRPRISFYDLVTAIDEAGDEYDDCGAVERTEGIAAIGG